MRDKPPREDASALIFGREFIIVIVVVFASLSFTLGYFVGKNNAEKKADYVVQAAPVANEAQQIAVSSNLLPVKREGRTADEGIQLQDRKNPEQAVSSNPHSGAPADKANVEHKETVSDSPKESPKKGAEGPTEASAKSGEKPLGSSVTYTVQLGALKNAEEARRLKAKYVKKGYKISISSSNGKHKEKIYKVRTGEFKEKKEAEILALRLKKSEGLAAFVTVKNE